MFKVPLQKLTEHFVSSGSGIPSKIWPQEIVLMTSALILNASSSWEVLHTVIGGNFFHTNINYHKLLKERPKNSIKDAISPHSAYLMWWGTVGKSNISKHKRATNYFWLLWECGKSPTMTSLLQGGREARKEVWGPRMIQHISWAHLGMLPHWVIKKVEKWVRFPPLLLGCHPCMDCLWRCVSKCGHKQPFV